VGSVAGGDLVVITGGDFGDRPDVVFGDRVATVLVNVAGVQLLVSTPTAPAGAVDVTITSGSRSGTLAGGFVYVDPSASTPGPPTPTTTTVPVVPGPGGDGGAPTPTPAPGGGSPDDGNPVDGGGAPVAPPTTEPAFVEGPGGLRLGQLPDDLAELGLAVGDLTRSACSADPCTTRPR
jgi:hypothetical protein